MPLDNVLLLVGHALLHAAQEHADRQHAGTWRACQDPRCLHMRGVIDAAFEEAAAAHEAAGRGAPEGSSEGT